MSAQENPSTIQQKKIQSISSLIGNTPLLAVHFTFDNRPRVLYAKAENLNMTGSIKDRMALHILRRAYSEGHLSPNTIIAEATSGNTGIAFSALGRALGHPVTIFMPDWMSRERIDLIRSLGASIHLVSKEEGGFLGSIRKSEDLASARSNVFLPRQFANQDNVEAHFETTGPEIWWQLQVRSRKPDAFIAGVGTGGTVMGVGKFLRSMSPSIKIHPLEPLSSPTLTTGYKVGKHRIQGISDEFVPQIVSLDYLDKVIAVDDGDAIIMAQMLAHDLGIGVGISSGANFIGALMVQEQLGSDAIVVTVFPDDNKKYLSTDLLKEEPVKREFLSQRISLQYFEAYKRVCATCCDPNYCNVEYPGSEYRGELLPPFCPKRSSG